MDKKRKEPLNDAILTGLIVAFMLALVPIANSYMPNGWNVNLADAILIGILTIIYLTFNH